MLIIIICKKYVGYRATKVVPWTAFIFLFLFSSANYECNPSTVTTSHVVERLMSPKIKPTQWRRCYTPDGYLYACNTATGYDGELLEHKATRRRLEEPFTTFEGIRFTATFYADAKHPVIFNDAFAAFF